MKTHISVIVTAIAVAFVASATAQKPSPTPAPAAKPQFQPPDMSAMWTQMMNVMYSPERAAQLAHFQKLYYDALVKEGFTKEDALSIVRVSQPMSFK
jgi:hypothetical protein